MGRTRQAPPFQNMGLLQRQEAVRPNSSNLTERYEDSPQMTHLYSTKKEKIKNPINKVQFLGPECLV